MTGTLFLRMEKKSGNGSTGKRLMEMIRKGSHYRRGVGDECTCARAELVIIRPPPKQDVSIQQ
jgi:hypothetical protein